MTSSSICAKPNNYVCLFKSADVHNFFIHLLLPRGNWYYVSLWHGCFLKCSAVIELFNRYFTTSLPVVVFSFLAFTSKGHIYVLT